MRRTSPARTLIRRAQAALRAALCALVVLGMLPGTHELLEAVEHYCSAGGAAESLEDGHLPFEAHDDGSADVGCDESTCTPVAHHCGCCASVLAVPASLEGREEPVLTETIGAQGSWERAWSPGLPLPPPLRPPIA